MKARKSDNGKKSGRKPSRGYSAKRKFSPNKIKVRKRVDLELDQAAGAGGRGRRAFDFPNF